MIVEKPTIGWESVGALDKQIQEIKEVIELPLKKPIKKFSLLHYPLLNLLFSQGLLLFSQLQMIRFLNPGKGYECIQH